MTDKPHIIRVVADEARRQFYRRHRRRASLPRPRIKENEIGVEFDNGEFIPYADLGYSCDIGFFRLSETAGIPNEAAPYAATGRLIDCGQVIVTTGASLRLTNHEISELLGRHASGDYGEYGEFYELDVDDDMLSDNPSRLPAPGPANKVNTLTGMDAIVSAYTVREHRIWVITEAGENRSTLMFFAGPAAD
jgi:hypothetical protein